MDKFQLLDEVLDEDLLDPSGIQLSDGVLNAMAPQIQWLGGLGINSMSWLTP